MSAKGKGRDIAPLQEMSGEWNNWHRMENIEAALANLDERLKSLERTIEEISLYLRGR
jgi:hypothetical protein